MRSELLGPVDVRRLAGELGLRPTKRLGQNFVHDPNTVRRIVTAAGLAADDVVVEVGPGLGSLTLALLPACARVLAGEHAPDLRDRLEVVEGDALRVRLDTAPTQLVANLPYNVSVPVVLHLLATLPSLRGALVMVQAEVADRMAAGPGSRVYGVPSVKIAWYARAQRVATVPRTVFWPAPNVDSALVRLTRREPPPGDRDAVFGLVDAAFAQRRKTLRAALAGWAGSAARAGELLERAGVDPATRGEQLAVTDFARVASTTLE
ncbi:MAG TPA: 16S rRNA (adenine(1518)-N(6)/adenine(1519)-N(6))-dimethyltransferase RsmA [Actinophytocola sp.]|nr:16S rRNA (adenine(1518)-N(6)/adenine(1519)-N(6))-dimethyltransferase RsmA [Actinophytocola sp.]